MTYPNDKWLALFLVLLLGLTPFVRSYADTPPNSSHVASDNMHFELSQHMADGTDCDSCTTAHNCGTGSCSCYQCGTCSVTILLEPLELPHTAPAPFSTSVPATTLSQHPFTLYRPPRA